MTSSEEQFYNLGSTIWSDDEPDPKAFPRAVFRTFEEARELLLKKHKDYGPKNISESPGGPLNGLLVRMNDKMARLEHLHYNKQDPENESLRDTFMDLANYGLIAVLVLDGEWPK